jgi:molybdopterin/thiamine biosynthesis adenylyltransferase
MIWKDRVKQYPHRYKLTHVSGTTYDFEEVTGEVTEAGTPVNAENLNKLIHPYDIVIRTQAEFETLIASPTWLGAQSVALVGQFTYSEANNSGIKIPSTVKQIHGFNSAKITVTNFVYNSSTAKGGLWYDTLPTTLDYSIRDLVVDCTGTGNGYVFSNCTNLTNCTGTGTGTGAAGYGFRNCTNLTNCTGTGTGKYGCGFAACTNLTNCTGTGTGTGSDSYGFRQCTNLTNCTGTGTGKYAYGFRDCTNLTNCTGTGTGTGEGANGYGFRDCANLTNCTGTGAGAGTDSGYGFYDITYASNCKDGGSSTNMWGGANTNIDLDTCCKTPVTANNTTLNT